MDELPITLTGKNKLQAEEIAQLKLQEAWYTKKTFVY